MRSAIVSLLVGACLVSLFAAEPTATRTYEQTNSNVTPANIKFFEDYLSKCPENEIRCVWFLDDHIKVGMIMTMDLQKYEVATVREVYDWASQNSKTRKLSHSQVESLRSMVSILPQSTPNLLFGRGIHVAFVKDGKVQSRTYDRRVAPQIIQRLYDIGGGYVDCQFAKEGTIEETEQDGGGQPATRPESK